MTDTKTSTILIVDDDPANIQLVERFLTGGGYENIHATIDPTQASALYDEVEPDLVMLDLNMPILDGFGVMAQLSEFIDANDYVPILVLTGDITQSTKQKALAEGAKDFITKPFDPLEMVARVANLLDARSLHLQLRHHNEKLEEKVAERTAALWKTVGQLERTQQDLRLAQEETIHSLSLAAEYRDDETSRHIERMSRYCAVIANAIGFDDARLQTIRVAAKMHDVGKIGVPDRILLKPGKLTPEEFEIIKTHAQIGYDILSGMTSDLGTTAATIAWTHHEKVDGTGYPRGLAGEEIPLDGRLAAVADVFDALTTHRVYRRAFSLPEALDIMRDGQDTHFDGRLLGVLFDRLPEILTLKQKLDEPSS